MVTPPDIEAQILRYYHAEKWTVGTIARQLHVHHNRGRIPVFEKGGEGDSAAVRQFALSRRRDRRKWVNSTSHPPACSTASLARCTTAWRSSTGQAIQGRLLP
jgi:hypothetical protein